jgi:alkaline phosphatase D
MGEFAPPDAYLEGEKHPFYGSENEWNRRFFTEHIKNYYKRRGQRQMLDIIEGRIEDAENYCRDLLEKDPNDLESLFNLAVALAHQNKISEAMLIVKEAVDKGFPFSRFLAGPRDILKPLTKSEAFIEYSSGFNTQIIHGPLLGNVTDRSASFWFRTVEESDIQVKVSYDRSMNGAVLSNIKRSSANDDFTVIVQVDNLKPDTQYYYEVLANGEFVIDLENLSFRTYPSKATPSEFSIAFGGGAGYVPENERIWNVIQEYQPSAFLWMGDNVYINIPDNPNGVHYYTYYRRQSRPEFRALVSSTSNYAIWDDHDAATDDVWLGPYNDKPEWKIPLLNVFKQNWINPFYGSDEWPACWHSFKIGDVEFYMLDGRFYRTNPFSENPTMLGPTQKAWLLESLKQSEAVFKVIVSPVPWSYEAKKDAKDTWNGFHDERNQIFDFISHNNIEGVILLSADRHRSDAWEIKRDNDYSFYEFTSSRLTNQHFHELIPASLFGYNEKQSFGLLTFNTKENDPTISYDIISIDNEKINSFTVMRSNLQ